MNQFSFETNHIRMEFDEKGTATTLLGKEDGVNYLPAGVDAPLATIRCKGKFEQPSQLTRTNDTLQLFFEKNQIELDIQASGFQDYLTFEITRISNPKKAELVLWGPYPTTIKEIVGENVGVVRDANFAFGIQSLNMKTLGGYPHSEEDKALEFCSFDNSEYETPWIDLPRLDPASFIRRRGDTAAEKDFGSVLQAYCRDRNEERIIQNTYIKHDCYTAPAFDDGGVVGSKIALFGCPVTQVLPIIEQIELAEDLPHPTIDGKWFKTSPRAKEPYLRIDGHHYPVEEALELTRELGFKHIYFNSSDFESWGHFPLSKENFPENWESLRKIVKEGKTEGIEFGIHTLTNFITPNDPYVTPVPDKRLAKVGSTVLTADISAEETTLPIDSPEFFNQMKVNIFHAALIGEEIVCYKEVSTEAPWRLTGCVRGAFGTKPTAHRRGEPIGKLLDHGYGVFLGDADLNDEIAETIARFCNETGVTRLAFDGIEGTAASGLGYYAFNRVISIWYQNLRPEIQGRIFWESSIPTHFTWHASTTQNWGEPHYSDFRRSQLKSRLSNLGFYRRNYLPGMLGCFKINVETSVEDAEWLGAQAVGHDAGYNIGLVRQEKAEWSGPEKNMRKKEIFAAIKTWEEARTAEVFTPEQKKLLRRMDHEFHLEPVGEKKWKLTPSKIERLEILCEHSGIPALGELTFDNPYAEQPLSFVAKMIPIGVPKISRVSVQVNEGEVFEIATKMEQYESLELNQNGQAHTFARNWRPMHQAETNGQTPTLVAGRNRIRFRVHFNGSGSAKLRIQVKTTGKAESVSK